MAQATLERGMGSLQTICQPKRDQPYPADAPAKCKQGTCTCEWEARWRENSRSRRKQFLNKAAGLKHLTELYNQRLYQDGKILKPKGKAPLFQEYALKWLDKKRKLKESSHKLYRSLLNSAFNHMGSVPIDKIKSGHIQALIDKLETLTDEETDKQVMYEASIHILVKFVIRPIFGQAIKDGWTHAQPCEGMELKDIPLVERYVPPPQEIWLIKTKIALFWRAAIDAMSGAGLREGEILALKPECIEGDELVLSEQWGDTKSGYGPLKHDRHKKGRRIPLDPVVKASLEDHIRRFDVQPGQPLFYSSRRPNLPYTSPTMHKAIREAVLSAGLEDKLITSHNFRHYFISMCVDRGIELARVAKMVGHYDIQTTFKTYYKPVQDTLRVRTAINGFMSIVPDNVVVIGAHALAKADNGSDVSELIKQLEALTGQQVVLTPRAQVA